MTAKLKTIEQREIANAHKGSNQVRVRNYNERLVLQLIRDHGALTKADAARATGLSANAASVIFKSLENEDYLLRGEPIRGRVGQPSVPMRLNPSVAYFFGLKIGRRSFDLSLMDFAGNILATRSKTCDYPHPDTATTFTRQAAQNLIKRNKIDANKIEGMGVSIPLDLWHWTDDLNVARANMEIWKSFDMLGHLNKQFDWPVFATHDGAAACGAELVFGKRRAVDDFLYFYIGTLISGGLVLNGSVFTGRTGKAGSFAPMPIPGRSGLSERLVDYASMIVLEQMIAIHGGTAQEIYKSDKAWAANKEVVGRWIDMAARGLAHAIVSSLTLIDFKLVVIDGNFPPPIRADIVKRVHEHVDMLDLQGIAKPEIEPGVCGPGARAMGAAMMPLNENYSINQNTLLRS